LLKELSLSTSDLLCIDDSPSFTSLPADALEIHLVDHNKLTLPLPEDRVRGVIDHHDDEGAYPNASPRVVEKAGSCASLVVETFFDASRLGGGDPEAKGQIARLALAAVLMDTANLTHKVTPHDTAAVELLRRECLPPSWDQNAFYAGLFKAKTSVDGLSLRDLLRKDYKEWTEAGRKIGIACVVKGVDWLRTKGDLEEALKSWGRERGLDIVGVMTTQGQGSEFRRELLLWALNPEVKDAVKCFERRAQEIGLGLETWKGGELDVGEDRKAWEQRNLAMSRKQISPLLRECLKEIAGGKSKV
jgi:exopolyphosphatase